MWVPPVYYLSDLSPAVSKATGIQTSFLTVLLSVVIYLPPFFLHTSRMFGIKQFFFLILLLGTLKWLPSFFLFFTNPQNLSSACRSFMSWGLPACSAPVPVTLSLSFQSSFPCRDTKPPFVPRICQETSVLRAWVEWVDGLSPCPSARLALQHSMIIC